MKVRKLLGEGAKANTIAIVNPNEKVKSLFKEMNHKLVSNENQESKKFLNFSN